MILVGAGSRLAFQRLSREPLSAILSVRQLLTVDGGAMRCDATDAMRCDAGALYTRGRREHFTQYGGNTLQSTGRLRRPAVAYFGLEPGTGAAPQAPPGEIHKNGRGAAPQAPPGGKSMESGRATVWGMKHVPGQDQKWMRISNGINFLNLGGVAYTRGGVGKDTLHSGCIEVPAAARAARCGSPAPGRAQGGGRGGGHFWQMPGLYFLAICRFISRSRPPLRAVSRRVMVQASGWRKRAKPGTSQQRIDILNSGDP
eukprot:gene13523-biopygen23052